MKNKFIGKNNKPYSVSDLRIDKVLYNNKLLNMYSMPELHKLYELYFGNYEYEYKNILKTKINLYDKSESVNSFIFKEKNLWLDKATRVGLMHLANCSTEDVQLILGDQILTFSPDFVKEFLTRLEVYAGKCYVQTQKHLIAVDSLKTLEEVINYDYTAGYPEKIVLE